MAESPVSPCVAAEGRIVAYPGAEVVVGTEVAGLIVRLTVKEKSAVRAGDLIAELNSADLRASRAEAVARVAEAEADIRFYDREVRRDQALLAKHATTPQNLDVNVRGLELARARREAALAGRDRLDALIAKTRITAPIDGVVTARHVQLGEIAEPGTSGRHDRRPEPAPDRGRGRRVRRRTRGTRVARHDHCGGVRPSEMARHGRGDPRFRGRPSHPPGGPRPTDRRPCPAGQDRLDGADSAQARPAHRRRNRISESRLPLILPGLRNPYL